MQGLACTLQDSVAIAALPLQTTASLLQTQPSPADYSMKFASYMPLLLPAWLTGLLLLVPPLLGASLLVVGAL
jgi:hypothetical protein